MAQWAKKVMSATKAMGSEGVFGMPMLFVRMRCRLLEIY